MIAPVLQAPSKHPAGELPGEQNAHILRNLHTAQHGVEWLVMRGFTVIDVRLGGHRPVIEIQNCARCGELCGAMKSRHMSGGIVTQVMAAVVEDAQVQWSVTGH